MSIKHFEASPVARTVPFDNSSNGMSSTDVQSAIDELTSASAWILRDEFLIDNGSNLVGAMNWNIVTAGSGSDVSLNSTNVDANHPGVARVISGGILAGACAIMTSPSVATIKLGGGAMYFEFLINITALGTATNDYTLRIGLGDSASADFTNGVYFQYTRATSVNWLIKTAAASTRTTTTTSTAVATGWVKLRANINAAGTSVDFLINGVAVGTVATNVPSAAISGFVLQHTRTAGTPPGTDIDYFRALQTLTVAR